MKKNVFVSVALATLLFASCSKETDTVPATQPGEKTALLELTLTGRAKGRATDTQLPADEGNVATIAVGVFNQDGTVNVIAEPTLTDKVLSGISCTPGTVNIIVVANAPAGTFAGVQNKDAFIGKTVELERTQTDGIQTSTNLPMSGEAESITLEAGKKQSETISLSRLVARIAISSIKTAFDAAGAYGAATFTPEKIFLYNAMSQSPVIPTAQPAATTPIHGGTVSGSTFAPGTAYLLDESLIPANPYTTPHWFYTFANDGKTAPTKLVIMGQFDADGAGAGAAETVYYPIVVNKIQTGTVIGGRVDADNGKSVIKRNSEYTLTAIIKGKGSENPATDIEPATLQLTVGIAPWALTITQEVTFE